MFGELPKLFNRDFAIAYFLPGVAFVGVNYLIFAYFGLPLAIFRLSAESLLRDLAGLGSLALLMAIILLIANRGVVRMLEGYWPFGVGYKVNWLQRWRFKRMRHKIAKLEQKAAELDAQGQKPSRELQDQYNKVTKSLPLRFPPQEHTILPTSFGNTFRAFETYPKEMYGIDGIPGWFRLLAVVPKDYRELIDSARARVDFWVNVAFLSFLVIVEFYILVAVSGQLSWILVIPRDSRFPWIPAVALFVFVVAYALGRRAAEQWGNWFKSAFDLYLPDLRAKLEFPAVSSNDDERQLWEQFNIAVLSRDRLALPEKNREKGDEPTQVDGVFVQLTKINDAEQRLVLEAVLRKTPTTKS